MDTYIGFDSAWLDNQRALGAICAIETKDGIEARFIPPMLATFAQAEEFICANRSSNGVTLVAIDQPTIVPNQDQHAARGSQSGIANKLARWRRTARQPISNGDVLRQRRHLAILSQRRTRNKTQWQRGPPSRAYS